MTHNEYCPREGKWYVRKECRQFSTDGTAMGAFIAHSMGTTDEEEIKRRGEAQFRKDFGAERHLTGMDAEQADWEADEEEGDLHFFH